MDDKLPMENEPAYRYGYEMAADWRYRSREWDDVEDGLRLGWEMEQDIPWERVEETVRQGWRLAKAQLEEAAEFGPDFDNTLRGFREHYEETFPHSPYAYDAYHPAYLYGFFLAGEDAYSDDAWEDVEPIAREHWEREYDGDWDDFSDAAMFGWSYVRRGV